MPSQPLALAELSERLKRDERLLGLEGADEDRRARALRRDAADRDAAGNDPAHQVFCRLAARLLELAKSAWCGGGFVIGLPVNLDASEGPRAQSTGAFARNLAALTELPMAFWDEAPLHRCRRAVPSRRRHQPQAPRRTHRQDGRRLHPARRAGPPELRPALSCMIAILSALAPLFLITAIGYALAS